MIKKLSSFSKEKNIKFEINIIEDEVNFMFDIGEELFKEYILKNGLNNKLNLFWYHSIVEFITENTKSLNSKIDNI